MVLHLSQVSSCSVSTNLRNSVLNFAVFTTGLEFKIGFQGVNKHSLLPWQRFSYDLNNGHFRTSPVDIYLHSNLSWGQTFSFPTLFDSYRELLLTRGRKKMAGRTPPQHVLKTIFISTCRFSCSHTANTHRRKFDENRLLR